MVTTKDDSWMQVSAETHQPETERLLNHDHLLEIALTSLDHLESDAPREVDIPIDEEVTGPYAPPSTATSSSEPTLQIQELQKARVAASGTACCILGCLLAGPIAAIVAGFGAAYAAEYKQGPVGDVVRAVGNVALAARDKAREVDEKHHVVDSSKKAASEAWEKAKEMKRDHHIFIDQDYCCFDEQECD
jgi:hypothetical protein